MSRTKLTAALLVGGALVGGSALADPTTGITEDSIKIGLFGPMTGSAAIFGKAVFGNEAIFRDVNDSGGIHGRKLELVREDTACDPSKGIGAVKKLISQEEVFAINGGLCSGVVMAAKAEIEEAGLPLVIIGAANDAIAEPAVENIFQPVPTTKTVARTMVDFVMTGPGTEHVAIVSHSDEWGKSNRDPAVEHLRAEYGLEPVADLTMERGTNDATPQILRIKNSEAQAVLLMMYPAEVAIFLRDAFKYGLDMPIIAPQSVSLEDTLQRVGNPAVLENFYVFYPYGHPTDGPEMQEWEKLINKYYPDERVESFSFLGMGGALAMVEALERVGPNLTREKFIQAMDEIRDFETGIFAVPITCTPEDHTCVDGGAMARLVDGKVTVVRTLADE